MGLRDAPEFEGFRRHFDRQNGGREPSRAPRARDAVIIDLMLPISTGCAVRSPANLAV